jgi:hypothetical protein
LQPPDAYDVCIADAIATAEKIMRRIDSLWPLGKWFKEAGTLNPAVTHRITQVAG